MRTTLVIALLTVWMSAVREQVTITGTVYDKTMVAGLPEVTISNTRGAFAASDSVGHYTIKVAEDDTLYFSYLKKQTVAFPVKAIADRMNFNVSIDAIGPALMPAYVNHNSYYADSVLNRRENQAGFDYRHGSYLSNLRMMPGGQGIMVGVGLDIDLFFHNDVKRSKELMQKWLIEEEQDRYVDHRFSRIVVKRITGMDSADLTAFMRSYKPSYEFVKSCETDWELYQYIRDWGNLYQADKKRDSTSLH